MTDVMGARKAQARGRGERVTGIPPLGGGQGRSSWKKSCEI